MVLRLEKKFDSEVDLCRRLIFMHNVLEDWGLTPTQVEILVFIIRFGYSTKTRDIISEKVGISSDSLTSNVSYMRKGKMGNRKIKKVLLTGNRNQSKTFLCPELKDIKHIVESDEDFRAFYVRFKDGTLNG